LTVIRYRKHNLKYPSLREYRFKVIQKCFSNIGIYLLKMLRTIFNRKDTKNLSN
jgi:hypothetical protein